MHVGPSIYCPQRNTLIPTESNSKQIKQVNVIVTGYLEKHKPYKSPKP